MGQVIYVKGADAKSGLEVRELRSEVWMDAAEAGRRLGVDHFANTTIGVWVYESDLFDKEELRRRLLELVDHVCSPEFLPQYRPATPPKGRRK